MWNLQQQIDPRQSLVLGSEPLSHCQTRSAASDAGSEDTGYILAGFLPPSDSEDEEEANSETAEGVKDGDVGSCYPADKALRSPPSSFDPTWESRPAAVNGNTRCFERRSRARA